MIAERIRFQACSIAEIHSVVAKVNNKCFSFASLDDSLSYFTWLSGFAKLSFGSAASVKKVVNIYGAMSEKQ